MSIVRQVETAGRDRSSGDVPRAWHPPDAGGGGRRLATDTITSPRAVSSFRGGRRPWRRHLWVVIVLLAVISPARAEVPIGTADEAEVSFRLGNQAFAEQNYRLALGYYFVSNRLAPNRSVMFNIARCFESLGDLEEAHRYFREHALRSPDTDPKRKESEAALERIGPRVALVHVTSDPPGAAVYVGRKDLGQVARTPSEIAVKPGTYDILVELPGHRPETQRDVVATIGKTATVTLTLKPLTATLDLVGEPIGATVLWVVDGKTLASGKLPGSLSGPAGNHQLVVEAPGYIRQQFDLRTEPDERRRVDVRLDPQVGSVVVSGDEAGALIRLDGEPVGFTPAVLDRVRVGLHELEVTAEGFDPYRTTITVERDRRIEVDATLAAATDVEAASRRRESALTAPASIGLLTGYELRMHAMHTLVDALSTMRGLYVTNDYTYVALGFRGVSPLGDFSNRVQTQVDGHVINLSYDGSSNMAFEGICGLIGVDRIEVVRGPGSALYGSGATFGVLNVSTPDEVDDDAGSLGLTALSNGMYGIWGRAAARLSAESWVWIAGGLVYAEPHDYVSPSRVGSDDFPDGRAEGVGQQVAGNVTGKAHWRDLTLQWFYNERSLTPETAPFGADYGDASLDIRDRRAFVELRWEPELSETTQLYTRLAWDHTYYYGLYPGEEADFTESYFGSSLLLEGRVRSALGEDFVLTAGLLAQYGYDNRLENGDVGDSELLLDEDHDSLTLAAYALLEWRLAERLTLHAGLRFDGRTFGEDPTPSEATADAAINKAGFQGAVSPRLAIVWQYADRSALKAVLGSAYRAPSFYELAFGDGGDTQLPPSKLDPERIYTFDLELTQALGEDLAFVVDGFVNAVVDNVTLLGEGDPESPLVYANRDGNVSALGLELELQHTLRRGLVWSVAYGLTRARLGGLFDGEALENSPTHYLTLRAVVPIVPSALSLVTRATADSGRRDLEGDWTPAALVWDLGFSGRLETAGLDYSLQLKNVLDARAVHPGSGLIEDTRVPQPGRSILLELFKHF